MRTALLFMLLATLAACSHPPQHEMGKHAMAHHCPEGLQAATRVELYFGLTQAAGAVTAEQWQGFLDQVISPAFPDGLTVSDGQGRSRSDDGSLRPLGQTKILLLIVFDDNGLAERIAAVAQSYKEQFQARGVLQLVQPVCAAF